MYFGTFIRSTYLGATTEFMKNYTISRNIYSVLPDPSPESFFPNLYYKFDSSQN